LTLSGQRLAADCQRLHACGTDGTSVGAPSHREVFMCAWSTRVPHVKPIPWGNRIGGTWVGVMKRSTVSTAYLKTFLPLQLRPINRVVYPGSQSMPDLEGGFPLRCFQRLSLPNLATRRWP
jgi:hypothetical protein